ncbi:MAG TPA: protease pro-enzyme activation domain-containing protein [Candidatus Binataceae bacterium]|nr:protease pro-enzyme activation domain-containing protein [Candidatus Binataceae bacterium]
MHHDSKPLTALVLTAVLALGGYGLSEAQETVPLPGNHPPRAEVEASAGLAAPDMLLNMSVTFALRNAATANQLLAELQDPSSPKYHHWLSSAEFSREFDPPQEEIDAVAAWLSSMGFKVRPVSPGDRLILFSGTTSQVAHAFHTTIHNFGAKGEYGNIGDPIIPKRFSGVIGQIHGLDNFKKAIADSRSQLRILTETASKPSKPAITLASRVGDYPVASDAEPDGDSGSSKINGTQSFGPADFATFYDSPSAYDGSGGDCIAIVGDSDYQQSSVTTFNTTFSLPSSSITKVTVNGHNPGFNGDETEALLDLEWSHAVAPGATIHYYVGDSSKSVIAPIIDQINQAVNDNICGTISVSFSLCGGSSSFYLNTVSPIYTKAALQGQSIFVSSGDNGAAGYTAGCVVGTSLNVNEMGADPNVTAVGGASFDPNFNSGGSNTSVVTSTAQRVWNDPEDGKPRGGAGGGGASAVYSKPSYQTGPGVPSDGKRDVPDVALIASPYFPGGWTFVDNNCFVSSCDGSGKPTAYPFGGTSLSAPAWAGISKLIAQAAGARPGPLNQQLYTLANGTSASSIFADVVNGNNSFNGVTGFSAGPGFDLATGWGTVDIAALVASFNSSPLPGPKTLKIGPAKLSFGKVNYASAGSASQIKTITIANSKKDNRTAIVSSIDASPGFSVDPACIASIPAGKSLKCNITFTPQSLGESNASLTVNDNAGDSPQIIAVTGTGSQGNLRLTPSALTFTKVPLGTTSAPKLITLYNRTGSTFTITGVTNSNAAFVADASGCSGNKVPANSSCTVSVTYTPGSSVAKTTDALIISADDLKTSHTVRLSGTGQ